MTHKNNVNYTVAHKYSLICNNLTLFYFIYQILALLVLCTPLFINTWSIKRAETNHLLMFFKCFFPLMCLDQHFTRTSLFYPSSSGTAEAARTERSGSRGSAHKQPIAAARIAQLSAPRTAPAPAPLQTRFGSPNGLGRGSTEASAMI